MASPSVVEQTFNQPIHRRALAIADRLLDSDHALEFGGHDAWFTRTLKEIENRIRSYKVEAAIEKSKPILDFLIAKLTEVRQSLASGAGHSALSFEKMDSLAQDFATWASLPLEFLKDPVTFKARLMAQREITFDHVPDEITGVLEKLKLNSKQSYQRELTMKVNRICPVIYTIEPVSPRTTVFLAALGITNISTPTAPSVADSALELGGANKRHDDGHWRRLKASTVGLLEKVFGNKYQDAVAYLGDTDKEPALLAQFAQERKAYGFHIIDAVEKSKPEDWPVRGKSLTAEQLHEALYNLLFLATHEADSPFHPMAFNNTLNNLEGFVVGRIELGVKEGIVSSRSLSAPEMKVVMLTLLPQLLQLLHNEAIRFQNQAQASK